MELTTEGLTLSNSPGKCLKKNLMDILKFEHFKKKIGKYMNALTDLCDLTKFSFFDSGNGNYFSTCVYELSIELENEIDDSHQGISKSLIDTIWYFVQICIPEDHMGFALLHAKVGL